MGYAWKSGDIIKNVRNNENEVAEVTSVIEKFDQQGRPDTQANWITTDSPKGVYGCQMQLEDEGWHKKKI